MVVKKDKLNVKKGQGETNVFGKIIFITLGSLSLGFLFILCWFLLTGDERIFLHDSQITPQHFCMLFYAQSFFVGRKLGHESASNSDAQQLLWAF